MTRLRIRTLKPEVWADERIGDVSRDARLLFVGLITMADDEGRMRALPHAILGHVFPYDEDAPRKLRGWLDELLAVGLVVRYSCEGRDYLAFPQWSRHQKVNRAQTSVLPPPHDGSTDALTEGSVKAHGATRDGVSDCSHPHAQARVPDPDPDPVVEEITDDGRARRAVRFNRKPVPDARLSLAVAALEDFNAQAGTRFKPFDAAGGPTEGLKRILGALTDHPDDFPDVDACRRVTAAALRSRWWGGDPPSVGVVFGPRVVEQNLQRARGPGQHNGLTPSQIERAKFLKPTTDAA